MKRGFTLIETLIALTALMVLAGAGIAGFRQSAQRQSADAAQGQIVGVLTQAQANAAAGVKDTVICGVTPLTGWRITFAAGSYTIAGVCGASTFSSKTYTLASTISVTSLPNPNPILFRPLSGGTNVPSSATITLTGYGIVKNIGVTQFGQIRTF